MSDVAVEELEKPVAGTHEHPRGPFVGCQVRCGLSDTSARWLACRDRRSGRRQGGALVPVAFRPGLPRSRDRVAGVVGDDFEARYGYPRWRS